jgi:hypothetical protein
MEGHVKTLDRGMISHFDKLKNMVWDGFYDDFMVLKDYNQEHGIQLADQFLIVAARLVSPAFTHPLNKLPPRQQAQSPSPAGDDNVSSPSPGGRHNQMDLLEHHSIRSLHNKGYGLGDCCEDKHVAGDIAAIGTLQKSKWRTMHFSASEKKHF